MTKDRRMTAEVRLTVVPDEHWLRDDIGQIISEDRWNQLPWGVAGHYLQYKVTTVPVSPPAYPLADQSYQVVLILDNGNGFLNGRRHTVDFEADGYYVITKTGMEIMPREVAST